MIVQKLSYSHVKLCNFTSNWRGSFKIIQKLIVYQTFINTELVSAATSWQLQNRRRQWCLGGGRSQGLQRTAAGDSGAPGGAGHSGSRGRHLHSSQYCTGGLAVERETGGLYLSPGDGPQGHFHAARDRRRSTSATGDLLKKFKQFL